MANVTVLEPVGTLEELQARIEELSQRLQLLEKRTTGKNASAAPVALAVPPAEAAPAITPAPAGITEEELLVIAAAIGAYLGVRAHIRQIRLLSSTAWAQQGRVSIQASHSLQG